MKQPPLPFSNLAVPAVHCAWFRMANAGEYAFKRDWFYPFKTRFLQAHAVADGWDLQIIEKLCWSCGGSGIWKQHIPHLAEVCQDCVNGIYERRQIRLNRWELCGEIYHCPAGSAPGRGHREAIRGLIRHEKTVPDAHAFRAFLRLLLRYEPRTLWNLQTLRLKQHGDSISRSLRHSWRAIEIAGRSVTPCQVMEEIPF